MYKRDDLPKKGDLVLCTVKSIGDISIDVDLDEYNNVKGILPIDELSNRRVKNPREVVSEGKKIVCLVINSDPNTRTVILSYRRVSEGQRKMKLQIIKREQAAYKILELLSKEKNISMKTIEKSVISKILQKGKYLYQVFEETYINGSNVLQEYGIPKRYQKMLYEYIKKNFSVPKYERKGVIEFYTIEANGIDIIKEVFGKIEDLGFKILYLGAPYYKYKIQDYNPKVLDKKFKEMSSILDKYSEKYNISYSISEE